MIQEYWVQAWTRSAREKKDLPHISGWGDRTLEEILHVMNDVAATLDLRADDRLLDAGCGAGLFEIAYARWVREICAVDAVQEMVRLAAFHARPYPGVSVLSADIQRLPFRTGSFDKVLVNSAIQYLASHKEVEEALDSLLRVTRAGGIIMIALIPDAARKAEYLAGYHDLGLPEEEVRVKIGAQERVLWFEQNGLAEILSRREIVDYRVKEPVNSFQKRFYFDLVIRR